MHTYAMIVVRNAYNLSLLLYFIVVYFEIRVH